MRAHSQGVLLPSEGKEIERPETSGEIGFTTNQTHRRRPPITLKSLLNKVHPLKRFVYHKVSFRQEGEQLSLVAEIVPRSNSKPRCSGCSKPAPGYDHMPTPRTFAFVPLWNIPVFFCYLMRRVQCRDCGVKVEEVPWAQGKHSCCDVYRHFLASWAKRLSWKETAQCFQSSWDNVCRSVQWVVDYGLQNRVLTGITALGVDEVAYHKGHQYMTLVYQIDQGCKRLLGVIKDRKTQALQSFFQEFGKERCAQIKVVCSDMWKPYLKVIAEMLPQALNVLDRFHIVKKLNEAVDQVRRDEATRLKKEGYEPVLKKSRYSFLKRPENLTEKQSSKLSEVLQYDLKTTRAYYLKESFDGFWEYNSAQWARWYLRKWCARTMRSRLEPMKKFVHTLRNHEDLLMNYFKAGKHYNSGIVEGLNLRINLSMRKAYGYRSFDLLKTTLFHQLGDLPEPKFTHRFC